MSRHDIFSMLILALLVVAMLSIFKSPLNGAEKEEVINAFCFTEGANAIPCKIRTTDEKVWLATTLKWESKYVISDTYEWDSGELYLLLLDKYK